MKNCKTILFVFGKPLVNIMGLLLYLMYNIIGGNMFFEETQTSKDEFRIKLEYYKKILDNIYNRANSSSKMGRIAVDLCNFVDLYENIFEEDIDIHWMNDEEMLELAFRDNLKTTNSFIDHIVNNNKFYDEFSSKMISIYKNNKFPFYNKYNKYRENMRKISEREMIEIICSFLNNYDEKLCENFRGKIKENEIIFLNDLDIFDGLTINISCISKNFILLSLSQGKNIYFAKTLLHELGHSYEYKLQNDTNMSMRIFDTPFYEISSSFFEYAFLKYLEENNIYNNDVSNCLNIHFREIFNYIFDVKLVCKMKSFYVDESREVCLLDKDIVDFVKKIENDINFYELPKYESSINLISCYIYSLGMIFSVYLYDVYKNDPNNFKINFAKSLCEYPLVKDLSVFEKIGINKEELLNGKTYNKTLKKFLEVSNN